MYLFICSIDPIYFIDPCIILFSHCYFSYLFYLYNQLSYLRYFINLYNVLYVIHNNFIGLQVSIISYQYIINQSDI